MYLGRRYAGVQPRGAAGWSPADTAVRRGVVAECSVFTQKWVLGLSKRPKKWSAAY